MRPGVASEDEDEVLDLPMVERSLKGVIDNNVVNEQDFISWYTPKETY